MVFTRAEAKGYMTGAVLILATLLFVIKMLPYIWDKVQESPANTNVTLSDVPGGSLLTGFVFFLVVLMLGISLVIKTFDLV